MSDDDKQPVTVRFNVVDQAALKSLGSIPPTPPMREATEGDVPLRIVPSAPNDPAPQPILNTAIEAMVDTMHPGVGENDTLGAPYCFDRGLLRDFAARLIAAGYARRSDVEAEIDAALNCGPR